MCISMAACSAVGNKSKTPNSAGNNTTPTVCDINDKNGTDYSIVRDNGEYFIVFNDVATYQDGMQQLGSVKFSSMKDFKDSVTKGTLTDEQKSIMATAFKKDNDGKILACDFDNLFVPQVPETASIGNVYWKGGNRYSFKLIFEEEIRGTFYYLPESNYNSGYQKYYLDFFEWDTINVTSTKKLDDNKVETYYSTGAGDLKRVRYSLSDGEKIFAIDKTYRLRMDNIKLETSSDIPFSIVLYCIDGEERYVISLHGFTSDPTDEWLLSFGIEKFSE